MAVPFQEIVPAQYAPATAAALYTSPGSTYTRIDKLSVCNTSGSVATVTINIVPAGGSVANSNCTTQAQAIAAGQTFNSPNEYGHYLNPGDALWVVASAANALSVLVGGSLAYG